MSARAARSIALVVALVASVTMLNVAARDDSGGRLHPREPQVASLGPGFIGAAACRACHEGMHRKWSAGRHSKMLQPATPTSVVGDFSRATVTLRGVSFTLQHHDDDYAIGGAFPTPHRELHRVDYTLGSRRVQHYLSTLADGRIVVLPPTWDVERREWFHNLDIVNPDEATRNPVQVWNRNCFGCHVSGEDKGYDAATESYETQWTDFGTSCERCHGPGAAHATKYASATASLPGPSAIVVPTHLTAERSTMVCAQCHSLRDLTVPGFVAGADYFDYFTPILEYGQRSDKDPAYWPDGRPRRFSNDAIGFWQSRCYLAGGASCLTCHFDPHEPDIDRNPQLARTNNALCTKCHDAIGKDTARHSHHAPDSPGSSCVACHMPRTVFSLRARMPDHTISVPAPENTARYGIPNACSECHQDRNADWAAQTLAAWYPNGRRQQLVARADAFSAARRRDGSAVAPLIGVARDQREPPLIRANAVGYLRFFPVSSAQSALEAAAADEHAAVRAVAVLGLAEQGFSAARAVPVLTRALADPQRIVRIGAALSLVNLQVTTLPGDSGRLLEDAKRDYVIRAALLSDDAGVMLDIGKFHLLNQRPEPAAGALDASLRLDGNLQAARYFLAVARAAQGRIAEARELLGKIPKGDPLAPAAEKLLAALRDPRLN